MINPKILSAFEAIEKLAKDAAQIDYEQRVGRTPTAFRWTPAISAIWPKDYRPTMTGLLAMWEAMHEADEYSELGSQAASDAPRACWNGRPLSEAPSSDDGWIEWGGGECPVPGSSYVEFKMRDGQSGGRARSLRWDHNLKGDGQTEGDIIAYRVIK